MYILTNNHGKYICKNKYEYNGSVHERYSVTTNPDGAAKWETREKAENIKKNCLTRTLKDMRFQVQEIQGKPETEIRKDVSVDLEKFEENLTAILDDVSHIDTLISDIPTKLNVLYHALSVADREITDIHHWIEFDKFNACEGYKAFALLKEKLRHRRHVKDGIEILRAVSDMETTINNLKNRSYTPRELEDLFGG